MKAQMLKIAGVKSEKEFYKKFPDEASFMKTHGKEFKKAMRGSKVEKAQFGSNLGLAGTIDFNKIAQAAENNIKPANIVSTQSVGGQSDNPNLIQAATKAAPNLATSQFEQPVAEESTGMKIADTLSKYAGPAGEIVQGIKMLKEEKKQRKIAEQTKQLSDLSLRVNNLTPERIENKYVTPWDIMISGNQIGNDKGAGTNILSAQDGASLSSRGEIMNTYDPNTIYSDLGYEPLSDSDKVKQFYYGGDVPKAQLGDLLKDVGKFAGQFGKQGGASANTGGANAGGANPWGMASTMANKAFDSIGGQNAGGKIGGVVLGNVGKAFGPAGELVGTIAGQTLGRVLDTNATRMKKAQEATNQNINQMGFQTGVKNMLGGSAFAKDGAELSDYGWVSHDWQPQVIAKFGDYDVRDLFRKDSTMDTLRTGGNIRQNNMSELDRYALGGQIKTHWGGYAEPISENPYMPGTGETIMFRGQSHDESDGNGNTGIGVTYGDKNTDSYTDYAEYGSRMADVEVERNEPAAEIPNPETGDNDLVVYGNLKIPNQFLHLLNDPKAKGKKFKHYVANIAKDEKKQNNIVEKASNELIELNVQNPFDKLKMDALQANILGANMKLKDAADKKFKAASLQNAINDTAEEHGLDADHLAKGNIKMAKQGAKLTTAQTGIGLPKVSKKDYDYLYNLYNEAMGQGTGDVVLKFQKEFHRVAPEYAKQVIGSEPLTNYGKKMKLTLKNLSSNEDSIFGKRTARYMGQVQTDNEPVEIPDFTKPTKQIFYDKDGNEVTPYNRNKWVDAFNQVLPYIRPSDAEDLDPRQLVGEMMALSDKVEPVQAQTYKPQLYTPPSEVSYQDVLNANQADYNASQRLIGYNPEALSILNAQKYEANQKVLGEQFRANQAAKQAAYDRNIALINDANIKNLGILDQQYVRQQQALSNTKAGKIAALNSISSKYLQNEALNKQLKAYENLYDFRFGKDMRAVNMNELQQFNVPQIYNPLSQEQRMKNIEEQSKKQFADAQRSMDLKDAAEIKRKVKEDKKLEALGLAQMEADAQTAAQQSMTKSIGQLNRSLNIAPKKIAPKKKSLNGSIVKAIKNL